MVIFRKMTTKDIDQVSQLEAKTFSMPWSRDSFEEIVNNPRALFMIAVDGGRLAGTCGIITVAGEGDISNVAVDEQYKRQGIAYELVSRAMECARNEYDVKEFTLEVRVGNEPAIGLYKKLGFASEGIRPRFYEKPVEDAMIMWKRE